MAYVKSKKRTNKKCDRCGDIIINRLAHAKYCKGCSVIVNAEQTHEAQLRKKREEQNGPAGN